MSRTVWSIVIIGFLTAVFLVVAMFFLFKEFGQSRYSSATKLAQGIRSEFHFDSVGTATDSLPAPEGMKNVLLVQYETRADSKFDVSAQNQEMDKVAKFAAEKSDPFERKRIEEIRIRRTEIHGRGCFQQSYVSDRSVPNPYRGAEVAPPPRRP